MCWLLSVVSLPVSRTACCPVTYVGLWRVLLSAQGKWRHCLQLHQSSVHSTQRDSYDVPLYTFMRASQETFELRPYITSKVRCRKCTRWQSFLFFLKRGKKQLGHAVCCIWFAVSRRKYALISSWTLLWTCLGIAVWECGFLTQARSFQESEKKENGSEYRQ